MSLTLEQRDRRRGERGSVTVMTAVLLVGLVLVLGLSIDVSRIYMVRSGLQNAADAAALAAARELNSGTGGLADAVTQARAAALETNKYGLNRTGGSVPNVTISKVEFSTSLASNAVWYNNTNGNNVPSGVETSIKYVRVTTQAASLSMVFAAKALGSTHIEQRTATAGMSVSLNSVCRFFPIAVALTNAHPANHAQLNFNFTNISGNSATLVNFGYLVLEIPDISGNGLPETAKLAAGITNMTVTLGATLQASPSANGSNGPRAIADGANTRFDDYANGYSNVLNATSYPPDTNIAQGLTTTQYLNKSPFTAPSNPGQDDRRILVMPIVPVGTYARIAIPTTRFGAFLLRSKVPTSGPNAGVFSVEYLGDDFPILCGSYDPGGAGAGDTSLTKPVLYK